MTRAGDGQETRTERGTHRCGAGRRALRAVMADVSGATAIEYGLLCALIGVTLIAGAVGISGGVESIFKTLSAVFG